MAPINVVRVVLGLPAAKGLQARIGKASIEAEVVLSNWNCLRELVSREQVGEDLELLRSDPGIERVLDRTFRLRIHGAIVGFLPDGSLPPVRPQAGEVA